MKLISKHKTIAEHGGVIWLDLEPRWYRWGWQVVVPHNGGYDAKRFTWLLQAVRYLRIWRLMQGLNEDGTARKDATA